MSDKRTTKEAKQIEISYLAKLFKAMDIAKQARVGMTLTYFDVIELSGEINSLRECVSEFSSVIFKAREIIETEMGEWLPVDPVYLPERLQQLRRVLDILGGGGE